MIDRLRQKQEGGCEMFRKYRDVFILFLLAGAIALVTAGCSDDDDDSTPPTPDPMTWELVPTVTSFHSIRMRATMADDGPPNFKSGVEYYFECTNDSDASSGWRPANVYEPTSLNPDTTYTFRVKARDHVGNETAYSGEASATTHKEWSDWQDGDITGYSHEAPAGTDRLLVVHCHSANQDSPADFTSVTYGGKDLTQAVEHHQNQDDSYSASAEIWYLKDADIEDASGTVIEATIAEAGNNEKLRLSSIFYIGVNQFEPVKATGSYGLNPNGRYKFTVTVDLVENDIVLANCTTRRLPRNDFTWYNDFFETGKTLGQPSSLDYATAHKFADGTTETAEVDIHNNGVGALAVCVLNSSP